MKKTQIIIIKIKIMNNSIRVKISQKVKVIKKIKLFKILK